MLKEIIVIFFLFHFVSSQHEWTNSTRVKRSDKVSSHKVAIASGLWAMGKMALNQVAGNDQTYC